MICELHQLICFSEYINAVPVLSLCKEAFTHGNTSTISKRKFYTGLGQFSEHPCDQTSSHIRYHNVSNSMYGHYLGGLDSTPSQSHAFFCLFKMLRIAVFSQISGFF